jgi:thioesterase domain-containing protein
MLSMSQAAPLIAEPDPQLAQELERVLLSMPPLRAMGCRVACVEPERLVLAAPLDANVNDKGSAFGGSLAGLMTVACWGLFSARLKQAGLIAEVYVQDSQLQYFVPVLEDIEAEARLADGEDLDAALRAMRSRRKARLKLVASVRLKDGREAARLEGRFVALAAVG